MCEAGQVPGQAIQALARDACRRAPWTRASAARGARRAEMEAGARGGALLMPHQEPPHGVQPLSLTAEGLLRELVEEHRDPAFEYRSPQGWRRCGKWVGGATPIEDAKTKSRFSLLALWCAQVSPPAQLRRPRVSLSALGAFLCIPRATAARS